MGKPGTEIIVGGRNDPDWGPIVLAGLGGVHAELFNDVRLFLPGAKPGLDRARTVDVENVRPLDGFRGSAPLDVDAIATLIILVGEVLPRTSLDPRDRSESGHRVSARATGAAALDALMMTDA